MNADVDYHRDASPTAQELQGLFAQTTWAQHRTLEGIGTMLRLTRTSSTARCDGALIGYARAITDGVYRAVIDDVVVDESWRGRGVGQELVRRLREQLSAVEQVRLNCGAELVPYYERLGFRRDAGPQMRADKAV